MSVNVRNSSSSLAADPFLFCPKIDNYCDESQLKKSVNWGSSPNPCLLSSLHQKSSEGSIFDQFCPCSSSSPSSPAVSTSAENLNYFYAYESEEGDASPLPYTSYASVKEEPYDDLLFGNFGEDYFSGRDFSGRDYSVGIPPLLSTSEVFSEIPPLLNGTAAGTASGTGTSTTSFLPAGDSELEARYQDFMQIFGGEAATNFLDFTNLSADEIMDSDENEEEEEGSVTTSNTSDTKNTFDAKNTKNMFDAKNTFAKNTTGVTVGTVSPRTSVRLNASRAKVSRAKKAVDGGERVERVVVVNALNGKKNGSVGRGGTPDVGQKVQIGFLGDTSRRPSVCSSVCPSVSPSTTSDEDLSAGGSQKQSKRSSKSASPEAYVRRREKNNIAVRKSREKKRQEIKKFADEHTKLKREVEQIRMQNEKLRSLVVMVEEGIVGEKSKVELEALIRNAKKQLHWC